MSKQVINYDSFIVPELNRFSVRTDVLEDLSNKNKRFIDMKALQWDSTVSEIRREVNYCKIEIKNLKAQLLDAKISFINLVNDFKDSALEEDYKKLKRTIDNWNVDKLITRKEFLKLLEDIE